MPRMKLLILAGLLTFMSWADQPWRDKPYQVWNRQEVERILTESPWTKQVGVRAEWTKTGHEGLEGGPSMRIGKIPLESKPELELGVPFTSFLIRWASSRTIRAARARDRVLRGTLSPAESDRILAQSPEEYEVTLVVTDRTVRFPRVDESGIRANSKLRLRTTGRELLPTRVEIRRGARGEVTEVGFFFPKRLESGEPSIPREETRLEFAWFVGGAYIHVRFTPAKMRDRAGVDL